MQTRAYKTVHSKEVNRIVFVYIEVTGILIELYINRTGQLKQRTLPRIIQTKLMQTA